MTAIGFAYKSERVYPNGWESITTEEVNVFEREYRRIRAKSIEIDRDYIAAVDAWEDAREMGFDDGTVEDRRREMEEAWERVKTVEVEKAQAYKRANCPHTHVKIDTDCPDGMTVTTCLDCGAIF